MGELVSFKSGISTMRRLFSGFSSRAMMNSDLSTIPSLRSGRTGVVELVSAVKSDETVAPPTLSYSEKIHGYAPDDLLVHYKLNEEDQATIFVDSAGNYDASLYRSVDAIVYGVDGIGDGETALRFIDEGIGAGIDVPWAMPIAMNLDHLTASFWFNPTYSSFYEVGENSVLFKFGLYDNENNMVSLTAQRYSTNDDLYISLNCAPVNNYFNFYHPFTAEQKTPGWHHIGINVDYDGEERNFEFWYDGIMVREKMIDWYSDPYLPPLKEGIFYHNLVSNPAEFLGEAAHFAVWNTKLADWQMEGIATV